MELQYLNQIPLSGNLPSHSPGSSRNDGVRFQSVLDAETLTRPDASPPSSNSPPPMIAQPLSTESQPESVSSPQAVAAYKKQENPTNNGHKLSALQKYKDDQLLSNPGGDHYYLEQNKVVSEPKDQESFWGRVGKDLSDAFSNFKNFFHDLFFGAKIRYRDENNQIQEGRKRGLVGSVIDFFKDLGSALSFGAWRPDGEKEPQGFMKRVGFFFSKMKEAVFGDLIQGAGGSIIHMGEDLLFTGWNLAEAIPDATIGNFKTGKKITTEVFDNGQVALDYVTDILPTGDAWVRVHSPNLKELKLPILHNIRMPEHQTEDDRWRYVRNTPFRKAIETVGSLLVDALAIMFLGQTKFFSDEKHD